MTAMIQRKQTVHGGVAVIRGTRIPVPVLAAYSFEKNGLARAKEDYPQLTSTQILAAWEYAAKHLHTSAHDAAAKISLSPR